MPHVWKAYEKREKLAKRQRNNCHWCGKQMNRRHLDPLSATLDHKVRKADGGGGNIENLVAACKKCNEERGKEDQKRHEERKSK